MAAPTLGEAAFAAEAFDAAAWVTSLCGRKLEGVEMERWVVGDSGRGGGAASVGRAPPFLFPQTNSPFPPR